MHPKNADVNIEAKMTLNRRRTLSVLALGALSKAAFAQNSYPTRPVTWVVPFAAGGPTDAIARAVAQRVSIEFGQPIIIDNLGGAGGTVGASRTARAPADGYTLFVGHIGTMAAAPYLFKSLAYDPLKDFTPVFRLPDTPMALLVKADSKFKTAGEFFEEARRNPGKFLFGTAGVGSSSHLAAEHLASAAKVKFTFVPYKGTGPAMTDLVGGQIDAILDQTNVSLPQIQGGRVKALALTSPAPMPQFPGVRTLNQNELPGFLASTWYGVYAPAGTSAVVIETLNSAYSKVLADPQFTESQRKLGIEVLTQSQVGPAALRDFTVNEQKKWARVIRDAGIPPQS
jgi:tripartite-type tricarboxylate transporter receptor subunit TctC